MQVTCLLRIATKSSGFLGFLASCWTDRPTGEKIPLVPLSFLDFQDPWESHYEAREERMADHNLEWLWVPSIHNRACVVPTPRLCPFWASNTVVNSSFLRCWYLHELGNTSCNQETNEYEVWSVRCCSRGVRPYCATRCNKYWATINEQLSVIL